MKIKLNGAIVRRRSMQDKGEVGCYRTKAMLQRFAVFSPAPDLPPAQSQ